LNEKGMEKGLKKVGPMGDPTNGSIFFVF